MRTDSRSHAIWWLPTGCAIVYALAVLASFHDVIASVHINSDAALAPVLGQAIGHIAPGSYVSLGNHAWYEEWLFLQATRGVPAYRQLWEIAPMLWSLLGVGVLAWTAHRALDPWSAALVAAALVCAGAFGRFCLLAINWHSLALVHTILIGGVLVWLVARMQTISWRRLAAAAVGLGALSALPTASDSLFPFWALAPLVAATATLAWRASAPARTRLTVFTATVVGVAAIGGLVLASIMRHNGITSRTFPVALVAPDRIAHNLALLIKSYTYLAGGSLSPSRLDGQGVLVFVSAALALLALTAVADQVRRVAGTGPVRRTMSDARLAYVAFWSASLLATTLVFVASDAPRNALAGRYLLAGYAATAALLPLVAMRSGRSRTIVSAGVCVFALIAAYQVIRQPFDVIKQPDSSFVFPGPATADALVRYAQQQRVTYGYGGYWDAEELTWSTNFKVLVRPVRPCASRSPALCYPQLGMISSWYVPKARARSLLVVDAPGTSYNVIAARDPALGRPLSARRLGPIEVYVYAYDIASRLGTPRCGFSWAHPC